MLKYKKKLDRSRYLKEFHVEFHLFSLPTHQIQSRDRKLSTLQMQVNDLNKELAVKEAENNNQLQTIKMLQDKHRSTAGEVRNRPYCVAHDETQKGGRKRVWKSGGLKGHRRQMVNYFPNISVTGLGALVIIVVVFFGCFFCY